VHFFFENIVLSLSSGSQFTELTDNIVD